MTYTKLPVALFIGVGLFGVSTAGADVGGATALKVFGSSMTDVAKQITAGTTTTAARLRHDQNNQPGHEQPAIAMFIGPNGDNKTGIYVDRASNLYVPGSTTPALKPKDGGNGTNDGNAAQGAMALFQLVNNGCGTGGGTGGGGGSGAGGGNSPVCAQLVPTFTPTFITSHASYDYRAFNQPNAYTINGGSAIAIEYNYRVNDGNARTTRWLQVFNAQGQQILVNSKTKKPGEEQIYAKTNDDCNMNMDGHAGVVADFGPAANFDTTATSGFTSHMVVWRGCNGNGQDKGWMDVMDITCDDDKNPTSCTWADKFDIALDQEEQRSRGYCSVDINNKNTAVCSWTAGNDEPQTKGVWLAAADITPGKYTGTDQQKAVYWSKLMDGRKPAADGIPATYAERAMHERVMVYNPTTKSLEPSSYIVWRSGDAYGQNDNNNKGGTYYRNNIGVFQIDPTTNKLNTIVPLTDLSQQMLGLDGTHLGVSSVVFGKTDSLATQKPGLMLFTGSQNGGGTPAQINFLSLDNAPGATAGEPTAITIAGTASSGAASYDRSMYSNYLGQNPGNQGRNFSASLTTVNPFCNDGATTMCDKLLVILATTGKDPAEVANVSTTPVQDTCYASDDTAKTTPYKCAQLKLSSYITAIPVAQANETVGTGSGSGSGVGSGSGSDTGSGGTGGESGDLGGCSASNAGAGVVPMFFMIGLVAFVVIRRRRVEEN